MSKVRSLLGDDSWVSARASKEVYTGFVSHLTGVVSKVTRQMHEEDDIYCHAAGSTSSNSVYTLGSPTNTYNGGGGGSMDETFLAAVGEAIERYCISYLPNSTKVGSYEELSQSEPCVDPRQFHFFAEPQYSDPAFPFSKFDEKTRIAWSEGVNLRTGQRALLPSQMIYMSSWVGLEPEPANITYGTSNGLAAHLSAAQACLSGLFEIVERDAFVLTWYSQLSMPILPVDFSPRVERFWLKHVAPTGLTAFLVNLSSINQCPTVMAIVLNEATPVAEFAIGAASAATIESAAMKATVESFQTRAWVKAEQRADNTLAPDCDWMNEIRSFDDHVRLYSDSESKDLRREISFLYNGPVEDGDPFQWDLEGAGPVDIVEKIIYLDRLRDNDFYLVDCTSPDMVDERVRVIKVISPQLLQLDAGYATRFLGHPRIYNGAFDHGLLPSRLGYDDINHLPHPFP